MKALRAIYYYSTFVWLRDIIVRAQYFMQFYTPPGLQSNIGLSGNQIQYFKRRPAPTSPTPTITPICTCSSEPSRLPSQNKKKNVMTRSCPRQIVCGYGAPLASSIWMLTDLLPTCSRQKWRLCTRVKRLHYLHFNQICHTNLAFACFYLVFLCKWADFERRVACQPQHFWDCTLQNYYVLCTYVPYLLRENIS